MSDFGKCSSSRRAASAVTKHRELRLVDKTDGTPKQPTPQGPMNNHRALCDEFVAGFVIERYVAGKLPESETQAFEEHLLVCDRCQEELTLAVAAREALPAGKADAEPIVVRPLPWMGVTAGLALAAAAVAAILILPIDRVAGPIAELGRVTQPPIYLGVPVRQAPARPDSVFDVAMSAYSAGEYAGAIASLENALAAGVDPAPAHFFRGASLLMLDRDAADAFEAVIAAGESPYLAEAHYYLAKALLRRGDPDGALVQLAASSGGEGEIAAFSRALADSVSALSEP